MSSCRVETFLAYKLIFEPGTNLARSLNYQSGEVQRAGRRGGKEGRLRCWRGKEEGGNERTDGKESQWKRKRRITRSLWKVYTVLLIMVFTCACKRACVCVGACVGGCVRACARALVRACVCVARPSLHRLCLRPSLSRNDTTTGGTELTRCSQSDSISSSGAFPAGLTVCTLRYCSSSVGPLAVIKTIFFSFSATLKTV